MVYIENGELTLTIFFLNSSSILFIAIEKSDFSVYNFLHPDNY